MVRAADLEDALLADVAKFPQRRPTPEDLGATLGVDRISAADLKRLLVDLPGTLDLVDIRPPSAFADFALPGARNVEVADLADELLALYGLYKQATEGDVKGERPGGGVKAAVR